MIYLLPWLLMPLFALGQLDRFNLIGSEVVLHLNDLAVLLSLLFGILVRRGRLVKSIQQNNLSKPVLLWIAAMALSLAANSFRLSSHQIVVASLYALRWVVFSGLYFVISSLSVKERRLFRPWLLAVGIFVALTGLLQYFVLPNVSYLAADNWDDHYYRLIGVFLDPGFTGAILTLTLFLAFDGLLPKIKNKLIGIVPGLVYAALALTYSRASYLMYLMALTILAFFKKSITILIFGSILLALTFIILPRNSSEGTHLQRENSIIARIHNWQQSVSVWQKQPVLGIGFDAYRYTINASPESHSGAGADSSLLLVLATTGIIGFLAYVHLLRKMLVCGKSDWLFVASFIAVFVHSFFNNTLFYPWIMEWLWILLATLNESS